MTSSNRNRSGGASGLSTRDDEKGGCSCHRRLYDGSNNMRFERAPNTTQKFSTPGGHRIEVSAPDSRYTISTVHTVNPRCIDPTNCQRMKTDTYRKMSATMTEQDRIRLEEAINEACNSVAQLKTFDDVEDLMEIQNCVEIRRRFDMLIEEKQKKLQSKKERRKAELLERQQDFHKSIMDRMQRDKTESSEKYERLLRALGHQKRPSSSSSSSQDEFHPKAESTRIDITTGLKPSRHGKSKF